MSNASFGVVVIGRNEGARLERCLASVIDESQATCYVDSGSTDGSAAMARALCGEVVELDMSIPFTAARARNEGFQHLAVNFPHLDYVQFVDGDCEIVEGWLGKALAFLEEHADVAAVCGRRRERFPDRSVYNMLCDIEWDTPVGQTKACGGDVMMRTAAFKAVKGFRPDLIAGEEPELCVRLRAAGWKIWRLGEEMTLHDAAIMRFGQWWKRSIRAGYAAAQGAAIHGASAEGHKVIQAARSVLWGGFIPGLICFLITNYGKFGLILLLIYPVQIIRLISKFNYNFKKCFLVAVFLMFGKFPEFIGISKYVLMRLFSEKPQLIEYK